MSTHVYHKESFLARRLARSARAVICDDFSPEVLTKAKICLFDFLSCVFEARALPWSRQAIALARRCDPGANILGTDIIAHPFDAAFANATMGHGLVREDMHAASIGHHGVVVWPTMLALAQQERCDGASFLAAAIIGYETGARIGRALFNADLARLFRPTGIVAPIGAALGGSYLRRLDEEVTASAVALAANTSCGLNQWPHSGGSEMYFHPGFASRSALTAIALAEAGAYGSPDILEGEAGLFAAFRREAIAQPIELFADGRAEIMSVYNKPVPACNFAQTACQVALRIARDMEDDRSRITAMVIRVPAAAARYPGCDFKGPFERPLQAKMSIQYGAAAALARGVVEEKNYQDLNDSKILKLVEATTLQTDDAFTLAFPAAQGAEIEVILADGAKIRHRLSDVVPAGSEEIRERFLQAAITVIGEKRARGIETMVDDLEHHDDAGQLARLCAVDGPESGVTRFAVTGGAPRPSASKGASRR